MADEIRMRAIARMRSDFPTKFGIPRQSGLIEALESCVVFEDEFRDENMLRGIEQFSHLWLIWLFSENVDAGWSPTVRPPRLGGNLRMGVLATRSPFRPNAIGMSCVRLLGIEKHPRYGCMLRVAGADLMDGTPILDIKPYIPFTDAHPDASEGYTAQTLRHALRVELPEALCGDLSAEQRAALVELLRQDPRPSYQSDPERVYYFPFAGRAIRFKVEDELLTVIGIEKE